MKTIKPYLFTLLSLFFTSTVFLSCSDEGVETKDLNPNQIILEPQTTENPKEVISVKPYSLEENVNKYSIEYVNISNRMVEIFKENKKRTLDPSLKLKINSAKNLNQVISILNNNKTENNEELISLIIKKMKLTADFIKENKLLHKMTKLQIEDMLSKAFFKLRVQSNIVKLTSKTAMGGQCLQDFNNDIDRATNTAENANKAAVAAWVLAEGASWGADTPVALPALLIAMYYIDSEYEDQITYAIADYEDCIRTNCSSKIKQIKY